MQAYIALGLMFCGGMIVLAAVFNRQSHDRAIERRVGGLLKSSVHSVAAVSPTAVRNSIRSLDRRLRSLFAYRMSRSWGLSAKSPYLLLAGVIAATGAWGLVDLALHLPAYIAWLAASACFFLLPRLMLIRQQRRADAQFAELLPDTIDMVVRMVRAGLPVGAAIRAVGNEAAPPLSTVFIGIADLTEIGVPLPDALAKAGEAVGSPDFRFFGVAVALQQSTGGNLAATLETLSEIIRKRRAMRLKARAVTAEIRMSAIVMGSIPFFIVGALLVVSPGYLQPLISDPRGNIIIGSALLCLLLAGVTMRSMMRAAMKG